MRAPLHLNKRNAQKCDSVPARIVEHLHAYQIEGVRFIYQAYIKNKNVILNNEPGMNEPLQICAFLAAVKTLPVLVICRDDDISHWCYELERRGEFKTHRFLSPPLDEIDKLGTIVLLPHSRIKYLKHLKEERWPFLIVSDIDEIVNSIHLNRLYAKFCIGITNYDFIGKPDQNLQNRIIKWAKIDDTTSLIRPENWFRLTWYHYKKTNIEPIDYDNALENSESDKTQSFSFEEDKLEEYLNKGTINEEKTTQINSTLEKSTEYFKKEPIKHNPFLDKLFENSSDEIIDSEKILADDSSKNISTNFNTSNEEVNPILDDILFGSPL